MSANPTQINCIQLIRSLLISVLGMFLFLTFTGCSSADKKDPETAEALFERAKELDRNGRTEEAILKFQEVKNKFPYSKLAIEAELAAAEVSYKEENYAEAQVAYQLFRDLHPKHSQIPQVIYQLAMSIYLQIPDSIDRDLSITQSAIDTFSELINQYPDFEHVAEAKDKRLECLKKLTEKELYITNFYLKKKNWESALVRSEGILVNHKGLGYEEKALARAGFAAARSNKNDLSERYLKLLKQDFPNSKELEEVTDKYLH
jgi:outer membrane protein assembly factor BamD